MDTNSEIQNHPANTDQLRGYGFTNTKTEGTKTGDKTSKKSARFYCLIAAALILLALCPSAAADSFLPVMPSDTLDYYVGYGEPALSASLRGNNEFDKGESATLQVAIANKGELERLNYREYVILEGFTFETVSILNGTEQTGADGGDEPIMEDIRVIQLGQYLSDSQNYSNMMTQNSLAQAEMQIEAGRTTAESLNVKFECDSPYIEVETGGDYTFFESIVSGAYDVAAVPIRISPNAPAGEYIVNVTADYQYPSNAKMIRSGNTLDGGFTTFLYSDSYVQEYESRQVVMQIPIHVAKGASFEATDINGTISAGKTKTVSVTYTNVGDETAYNAECKLSLMYPLSSARNKAFLGDVAPGESVTIDYPIKSHSSAMAKIYGVNSDVRYYDSEDRLEIAPSIKLDIELINRFTIFTFRNALIGVLLLVALSLGYDYYKGQKRKKEGGGDDAGSDPGTDVTESEN